MDPIIVYPAVAAALATTSIVAPRMRRGTSVAARAGKALDQAAKVSQLIGQIQQHRGMSAAWLAGDASFAARLPEKQARVEDLLEQVNKAGLVEGCERWPCFTVSDVVGLRVSWRDLVRRLDGLTPEESFHEHCRIIALLLEWMAALVEARVETPFAGIGRSLSARNFAERLPMLTECLGQARALGSAVAAQRRCRPVARVRLRFLIGRAETLLARADAVGDVATCGEAATAVRTFVSIVREQLLGDEPVVLSATECFAAGTRAVDAVFAWLERERRALVERIESGDTGIVGRMSRLSIAPDGLPRHNRDRRSVTGRQTTNQP